MFRFSIPFYQIPNLIETTLSRKNELFPAYGLPLFCNKPEELKQSRLPQLINASHNGANFKATFKPSLLFKQVSDEEATHVYGRGLEKNDESSIANLKAIKATEDFDLGKVSPERHHYFYTDPVWDDCLPVLANYVPMATYAIHRFDGNEINRYMYVQNCYNCTKLVMYDPSTRTGFLSHILNEKTQQGVEDDLKTHFKQMNVKVKNLQVRYIAGFHEPYPEQHAATYKLLKNLGIEAKQIIEADPEDSYHKRSAGLLFDLKDGQTYDFTSLHDPDVNPQEDVLAALNSSKLTAEERNHIVKQYTRRRWEMDRPSNDIRTPMERLVF